MGEKLLKKWLLLCGFVGLLLSPQYKVEAVSGSYFDTFMKDAPFWPANTRIEKVPDYSNDYYQLQLAEDSLVTFTFDDPKQGSILVALLQNDGSQDPPSFAFIRTTKDDGDDKKTVQQIQLRAGMYYVRIDGPDGQPYNGVYTVAPTQSSIDVEPNNTAKTANPIPLNTPIKSVGTVAALADYYTFSLDKTSKVTLHTEKYMPHLSDGASQLLYVDVDDDKGHRYLATLTNHAFSKSDVEVLLPGTYTVKVSASDTGYRSDYQFILKTEAINQPETFKNSIFGTTLLPEKEIRGFLSLNDEYSFTLDHEQKVHFTIKTDSSELMSAILTKEDEEGDYRQIFDYQYEQKKGLFTMTAVLKPGKYIIEPSTKWQQVYEVNYTIKYEEVLYIDVPLNYRYANEILALSSMGIIQGHEDGRFKPKNPITRRQVFTMLSRYDDLNLLPLREMIQFKDLMRYSTDYQLISPFYQAGIVDGSTNRMMDLSSNLTRAQLAKILVNTFDLNMQDTSTTFNDVSQKHYAYEYIQILASNGITQGSYGNFMPNEPVSREHFSVFLYRLFEQLKKS